MLTEVHTLDQKAPGDLLEDMPGVLLARAGGIAAAGAACAQPQALEASRAFFYQKLQEFLDLDMPEANESISLPLGSRAISVIGDYMPTVESAQAEFERMQESEFIGDLMYHARLSKLTGCIMPDLSRNHKGYTKTAIKAVRELGLGTKSRETHRVAHFARMAERTGQLPTKEDLGKQVDHVCRNPACIYHTRLISGDENNELMAEARKIEPDIVNGQMLYITDLLFELPWLTFAVAEEGQRPAKYISTRLGPFMLRIANSSEFVVVGERADCEVFDSLKPLGKRPASRKSRAKPKITKPIEGHKALFTQSKFKKKRIPDLREKYESAMRAAA